MIIRGSGHGQTWRYLPGDPDLLRGEIRNHVVGPFAGCARVKGNIPEPGVGGSIYKVSTDTIARRGSAGQINLGITCTGQTTGLKLIE